MTVTIQGVACVLDHHMKRGTISHWKMDLLANALGVRKAEAVGIMEALWHFVAQYRPCGDIGAIPDAAIAQQCLWEGDPKTLSDGLVESLWVDRHPEHRLVIHDWPEHCEDQVHLTLARQVKLFWNGSVPRMNRFTATDRTKYEHLYAQKYDIEAHRSTSKRMKAHESAWERFNAHEGAEERIKEQKSAQPEPWPKPQPEPEPCQEPDQGEFATATPAAPTEIPPPPKNGKPPKPVKAPDSPETLAAREAVRQCLYGLWGYDLTGMTAGAVIQENSGIKALSALVTEAIITTGQIEAYYRHQKADSFWAERHLGAPNIAKNIRSYVTAAAPNLPATNGQHPPGQSYNDRAQQLEREYVEYLRKNGREDEI